MKRIAAILLLAGCATTPVVTSEPVQTTTGDVEEEKFARMIGCTESCAMDYRSHGMIKADLLMRMCSVACTCVLSSDCPAWDHR